MINTLECGNPIRIDQIDVVTLECGSDYITIISVGRYDIIFEECKIPAVNTNYRNGGRKRVRT